MFCILDEVRADIARDALQHFAVLSTKKEEKKGRILRASKALQRMLSYDLDTPFPQDLTVLFGEKTDKASVREVKEAIQHDKKFFGEVLCYKHSGHTFRAELTLQPIFAGCQSAARDSSAVCVALFLRDIEEIHSRENRQMVGESMFEELKEDHAEQARIVREAIANTLVLEPVGNSSSFQVSAIGEGEGIDALTGYASGELANRPMSQLYGPGTSKSDRQLLERAMQDHEPLSCDIMCYTKDEQPFWRHMLALPITSGAFLTFNVDATRQRRYVGNFLIGHSVGRGSFGTVKLGRERSTGDIVAIKRINDVSDPRAKKLVDLEIAIQGELGHSDLICTLREVMKVDNMVFMVMDHCAGGSVFDALVSKGCTPESTARNIFRQMVLAVDVCHRKYVVHRDLKPENILLDDTHTKVTLIDFGLATYFQPGQKLTEVCGSKRFQAPEVMKRATSRKAPGYLAPPVDVWSLAVILFELVHGQIRLSQSDSKSTAEFIEKYCARQSQRGSFSRGLCEIMRGMLIVDPEKRFTIATILDHPWLEEDVVSKVPGPRGLGARSNEDLAVDSDWDALADNKTSKLRSITVPKVPKSGSAAMRHLTSCTAGTRGQ